MKRGKTSAPGESANPEANRGSRAVSGSGGAQSGVDDALDALYASPFDEFVAMRTARAREVRSGGDPAGARAVAGAAKPTRTAWALNQVARRSPAVMNAIVDAWKVASNAPLRREGVDLVDAARRYREAVAGVVREARAVLEADGVALSPAQARRMSETLQALVSDEAARAELLRGRLTRDVAIEDPFAGLDAELDAHRPEASRPDRASEVEEGGRGDDSVAKASALRERERMERERAENQRAARERAEREAKARAREVLRAKIASTEGAVQAARHRVQLAQEALARAHDDARHAKKSAEQYEAELASLREEWEKLAR